MFGSKKEEPKIIFRLEIYIKNDENPYNFLFENLMQKKTFL